MLITFDINIFLQRIAVIIAFFADYVPVILSSELWITFSTISV